MYTYKYCQRVINNLLVIRRKTASPYLKFLLNIRTNQKSKRELCLKKAKFTHISAFTIIFNLKAR